MNAGEVQALLEALTGQAAPLRFSGELHLFEGPHAGLGYSQLNELLLLFGFDRVGQAFFQFLLDGTVDYLAGNAICSDHELVNGVRRFRELALLLYGNVKFGSSVRMLAEVAGAFRDRGRS